jgi:hypothetical protein
MSPQAILVVTPPSSYLLQSFSNSFFWMISRPDDSLMSFLVLLARSEFAVSFMACQRTASRLLRPQPRSQRRRDLFSVSDLIRQYSCGAMLQRLNLHLRSLSPNLSNIVPWAVPFTPSGLPPHILGVRRQAASLMPWVFFSQIPWVPSRLLSSCVKTAAGEDTLHIYVI